MVFVWTAANLDNYCVIPNTLTSLFF
jgi:hypothetical protein